MESYRELNPSVLCLLYFASVLLRRGTVEVKSNSEQAAATALWLDFMSVDRGRYPPTRSVARFAEAFVTSIQTACQHNPRGFFLF